MNIYSLDTVQSLTIPILFSTLINRSTGQSNHTLSIESSPLALHLRTNYAVAHVTFDALRIYTVVSDY